MSSRLIQRLMAAALAAAMSLSLPACAPLPPEPELHRYEASFLVLFDTVTTIVGYAENEETFKAEAQFVYDELERYHQLYDIYHEYEGISNLKTVNDHAGETPVPVDKSIIDLLLTARQMNDFTGGKVNVAMGSVLSLWHDYRASGIDDPFSAQLPPLDELQAAAEHADIDDIIIDKENNTVYFADPLLRLDVGAIAKGYATQKVCDAARGRGITSLLVSVGGNVCAVGSQDGASKPWRVGIRDPGVPTGETYLHTLGLTAQTLVTSGDDQRYYTVDGQQYHHIIDPDTLMPADYFASVTVLAEDSGVADAMSTALYNLPLEPGLELVEQLGGTEAMWVLKDGSLHYSSGFLSLAVSP